MNISNNKIYLITGFLGVVMVLVVLLYNALANQFRNSSTQVSPTPTVPFQSPTPINIKSGFTSRKIETIPTLNPTSGYGVDLNSPEIISSKNEINKITDDLPYNKSIATGSIQTDIFIPVIELMTNDWSLTVDIYGVDYQVSEDDPEYAVNKQAFIAAAQDVYFWLKSKGVATENIVIQWGDRAYIQDRSQQWLQ